MSTPSSAPLTAEVEAALRQRGYGSPQGPPPVPPGLVQYTIALDERVTSGIDTPENIAAILRTIAAGITTQPERNQSNG